MILKGEAWKFRPKTEEEFKLEGRIKAGDKGKTPKILETIRLAAASKNRDKFKITGDPDTNRTLPYANLTIKIPKDIPEELSIVLTPGKKKPSNLSQQNSLDSPLSGNKSSSRRGSLKGSSSKTSSPDNSPYRKMSMNKQGSQVKENKPIKGSTFSQTKEKEESVIQIAPVKPSNLISRLRTSVLNKITVNRDVLNFENNYFAALVKTNLEYSARYLDHDTVLMKFDRKLNNFDMLGEMSMNLNSARNSSVLAFTELHVWYLDQKGYEMVFANQLQDVKDKLEFFQGYFKEMKPEILRRLCFLFEDKHFQIGEYIYKEGDECDGLYFIKSGEAHVLIILLMV